MAEFKDRSFIFKVLYVLLSIITFPIFLILFILRHPLWILIVLLFCGGFAVYYPISEGVKLDDAWGWYQKKFADLKHETVLKAREKGITELVPQAMLNEVKKMEEEAEDAKLPKGENYNNKVMRGAESEEMKQQLKQRKGFKKREVIDTENASENLLEESVTEEESVKPDLGQENSDLKPDIQEEKTETDTEKAESEDKSEPDLDLSF